MTRARDSRKLRKSGVKSEQKLPSWSMLTGHRAGRTCDYESGTARSDVLTVATGSRRIVSPRPQRRKALGHESPCLLLKKAKLSCIELFEASDYRIAGSAPFANDFPRRASLRAVPIFREGASLRAVPLSSMIFHCFSMKRYQILWKINEKSWISIISIAEVDARVRIAVDESGTARSGVFRAPFANGPQGLVSPG